MENAIVSIELDKIDGPHWNNFNACSADDYIATYKRSYRDTLGKWHEQTIDLYMVMDKDDRQVVLWRDDEKWQGSYGACPVEQLIAGSRVSQLNLYLLSALLNEGELVWKRRK